IVVLRQMAGRRTELVGLKDDEDRLVLLREPPQPLLNGEHKAEHEQGDRRAADRQKGAGTMPPERLEQVGKKPEHQLDSAGWRLAGCGTAFCSTSRPWSSRN